jgi:hypothetical protein
MTRRGIRDLSLVLFTLGGAITGVFAFRDRVAVYLDLPAAAFDIGLLVGIVLTVASAAVWLLARLHLPLATLYYPAAVRPDQLQELYGFISGTLDGVAPYEVFRAWYDKNPEVIRAVVRERAYPLLRKRRVVGFYSLFPVSREARDLLSRNILKGTALEPAHILPKGRKPAALYIGAIGAKGRRGREATLQFLMGQLASEVERRCSLVFTRPMTPDGLRLARKYGFREVEADTFDRSDTIYVRDFSKDPAKL